MPEKSSNQFARVAAVLALIAGFLLVVVTIAGSGGDDDDSGDAQAENGGTSREGERALERGVWIVRAGDTLVSISEETGIETDELLDLNPEIDPQAVRVGQRLILREGVEIGRGTDAGGTPGADATGIGDEGPTGTGVGDGGPTGTETDTTTTDGLTD
ncbi:MAG: LysM peptidoglycan-binding domain-containing protein [Solirubrobacterales bacterium]